MQYQDIQEVVVFVTVYANGAEARSEEVKKGVMRRGS